jgi:hypothetical protein
LLGFLLTIACSGIFAQGRLILNGAKINIAQGATVVIDNPAANAVTRLSGHIISEGENNILQWNIGTATGNYTVPWGYGNTNYLPLSFTLAAGAGSGSFRFSTYHTGWQNSTQLPGGITTFNNASGSDKSVLTTDRFWQIHAQNYTAAPALSTVIFTYLDTEFSSPNIATIENALTAQRWNDNVSSWLDYAPASSVDVAANTVTLSSVDASNLYPWWVVTYIPDRHWVAATASNWNDPMNWSTTPGGTGGAGVPASFDDVFFDDVRDASFTLDSDATMESLTLETGYTGTFTQGANTLTINGDATFQSGTFSGGTSDITVAGDFTLTGASFTSTSATLDLKSDFTFTSGTFAHNNGTVAFSGTGSTQNIGGSAVTNFKNITVTNTAATPGASIQSNQNLEGTLTLAGNVIMDADGSGNTSIFTLRSTGDNPTQDAAIAILPPGAQVTGNVTVQRYMTKEGANSAKIYRYISSPVQNASVADIQNEIPVTGPFAGANTCSGCGTGQSMFSYNESIITDADGSGTADLNDGYTNFPSASNTEVQAPGKGYALYVRGNILSSTLWDVRGIINAGNITPVSIPVTFTSSGNTANDGWNLVGNPFPSTIDWSATSGWTKTNLDATVYIRDNGNAATQVATWNGVTGTNGGSRYIATGQGFWVKATGAGAPVLQATENVKAAGTQTTFFRQKSLEDLLRITLVKGTVKDDAVIHFREDATPGFDHHADALKLPNGTLNLSTLMTNGTSLAINSMPSLDCQSEIRLTIAKPAAGNYRFDFSEYESFANTTSITLTDNFTHTTVDIRNGSYDFTVTTAPASYGADRFKIAVVSQPPATNFLVSAADVCEGTDAILQLTNTQDGAKYVALFEDNIISPTVIGKGNTISIVVPGEHIQPGRDSITVKAMMPGCSSTVLKNIALNVEEKFNITATESGKHCKEGAVTLKASGARENGYYNWYESKSSTEPIANQHDSSFTTPPLATSTTYYVAVANALGCEGLRSAVSAEIVQFEDIQIIESGDSLKSTYTNGNQWYFNHELIFQATQQSLKPDQSGTYSVETTIDGCVTSTDHVLVITATERPAVNNLSVFPNPVSEQLTITIPDPFKNIREVMMINSFGQVVKRIVLQPMDEMAGGIVDMTGYPAGIYILQAVIASGVVEVKVVKQ